MSVQVKPQIERRDEVQRDRPQGGVVTFEFYTGYQTIHLALGRHRISRMGRREA
jgi:hypothetical protein